MNNRRLIYVFYGFSLNCNE